MTGLAASKLVHRESFGKTEEGREMPMMAIADPKVTSPEAARKLGRPIVFVQANIHAGEVEGKEAILVLARRLVDGDLKPLTRQLVILIAPDYNADGNEKVNVMNRTAQNGPVAGVGTRENAKGLDLNRDYMKLDSAEARALVGLMNRWDPHVAVDLHTTNGSYHGFHLTYSPIARPERRRAPDRVLARHACCRASARRCRRSTASAPTTTATSRPRTAAAAIVARRPRESRQHHLADVRSSPALRQQLRRPSQPHRHPVRGLQLSRLQGAHRRHRGVRRGGLPLVRRQCPDHPVADRAGGSRPDRGGRARQAEGARRRHRHPRPAGAGGHPGRRRREAPQPEVGPRDAADDRHGRAGEDEGLRRL